MRQGIRQGAAAVIMVMAQLNKVEIYDNGKIRELTDAEAAEWEKFVEKIENESTGGGECE